MRRLLRDHNMRRLTMPLLGFFGFILVGCQTTYVHFTKTAADFEQDKFDCQTVAEQSAYNVGQAGNFWWINNRVHQCLQSKHGWRKQQTHEEQSTGSSSTYNESISNTPKPLGFYCDAKCKLTSLRWSSEINASLKKILVLV